jgi:release factor glutamine methyltransferase
MTIRKLLIKSQKLLAKTSPSANLDAEILLLLSIGRSKTWVYSHPEYTLSKSELEKFQKLIKRRLKSEPVAYITGHKEFYGLDFLVNTSVNRSHSNVLIPRPETEIMIEQAIKYIKNRSLIIADVGTGSGCIAISIAKNCPNAKILAFDISKKAINIARKNARRHRVFSKIKFGIGDLLFPKNKFDIVLANLPYLRTNQIKNELRFEPRTALDGGPDGTFPYQKFFGFIKNHLVKKYLILIEIDPSQVFKLKRIIRQNLDNPLIKILKDYSGLNRFLKITSSRLI